MGEQSSGGLAITARDAYNKTMCIFTGKFYFRDNANAFLASFFHDRSFIGDTRTFHNHIGGEDFLFGMEAFFPFYTLFVEGFAVVRFEGIFIGKEYLPTFLFTQNCGTYTTLTTT